MRQEPKYISKMSGTDYTLSFRIANYVFWGNLALCLALLVLTLADRDRVELWLMIAIIVWVPHLFAFVHMFWLSTFCEWRNDD